MPVLAVGLVTVLIASVVSASGAAIVARHRAQAAADTGALAAAAHAIEGEESACAVAATIVADNGGHLVTCRLDGWDAVVAVQVLPAGPAAAFGPAEATARAGPATTPP